MVGYGSYVSGIMTVGRVTYSWNHQCIVEIIVGDEIILERNKKGNRKGLGHTL